ncbi:D-alanyl-D-alanine carboxypeptidase/D-alanyl-D-alanine-endopeptidase (penicillin-binding protein 4) [Sphingomonas jinjuensis]|uniref:D-alanyl-D-alanine carboxypeptidase/D-alanyl-D-alanine-endopeptidase (Penicillin-binding protein 4) n=1 Tax=Sphingomonas jinjuensis TaxID=535907 RepID=A0A840F3C7_9SPHN|nr:D-alanyl-D-alanine carboxypeptidase/D-alanyl-D-alanine-endopeptidase [Sphingomonas jinjuensis]MBB4153843.1 D-alanyl-D-alanine carboxypeptidase/D-alanyl-D-alanine-endopeptidase (penicillin-binding protein 4) [Sphingomonas jinjuensis]
MRALLPILLIATPALADPAATLHSRLPAGARAGLLVVDEGGREIVAVDPDGRYIPASNTKLFTTAAAYATLPVDAPDDSGGASVRLEGGDVILAGHGDARLSSAPDCRADCLATLADAVAAVARRVRDVVGDDSAFPDERWSPGMSWNNIPTRSGTGISALTLDDNEAVVTVTQAGVTSGYFAIDNHVVPGARTSIDATRMPGERSLRLDGTIAPGGEEQLRVGIDDPAHHAAWRLKTLLEARGVRVTGGVQVRHRRLVAADDPAVRGTAPAARPPEPPVLARLTPPPLAEDIALTNKVSQNLHAELLLRRLGAVDGTGSIADGRAKVAATLVQAGAPRAGWDFADGSGMSSYNRVSPRAGVALLRWAAAQPWGAAWRATLPIGGLDGTLKRRFAGTALAGKIFAKTGTLSATSALSGYLIAASGRVLTFSSFVNDVTEGQSGTAAVDATLVEVAADN